MSMESSKKCMDIRVGNVGTAGSESSTILAKHSFAEILRETGLSYRSLAEKTRLLYITSRDGYVNGKWKVGISSGAAIGRIANGGRVRRANAYTIVDTINEERQRLGLELVRMSDIDWQIKEDNPTNAEIAYYMSQKRKYAKSKKKVRKVKGKS